MSEKKSENTANDTLSSPLSRRRFLALGAAGAAGAALIAASPSASAGVR